METAIVPGMPPDVYVWWDWPPNTEQQIMIDDGGPSPVPFPVGAGDSLLCALDSTPGSQEGSCWLANVTRGVATSISVAASSDGPPLTGQYALWIVESPRYGELTSGLANFGTVTFTYCSALTTAAKGRLDLSAAEAFDMESSESNALMATGQVVNPSTVQCTFQGVYG